MPFSSLKDPVDIARAHGAFDRAYTKIVDLSALSSQKAERERLLRIILDLIPACDDDTELVERALRQFERAKAKIRARS